MSRITQYPYVLFLLLPIGCTNSGVERPSDAADGRVMFTKVDPVRSNISFQNKITESPDLHYFNYQHLYTGGGVGVGDINNDGLPDVYFVGNQVEDKLYLNKGNMVFEDITQKAIGITNDGWHNAVSMIDINADGWLDIYICRSGWQTDPKLRANLLYINNGDGTFEEDASRFGLADTGYSRQALFFDMDNDSDLDVFIMNRPVEQPIGSKPLNSSEVEKMIAMGALGSDKMYRNDDGYFTDVTRAAGVSNYAFGLGVVAFDANEDGWMDLYVANDYSDPDHLYVNQRNGSFKDEVNERTKHVANFAMGADIADINNDGDLDIAVLDMAYKSMVRSKQNMGSMQPAQFWAYINAGYQYQYMINTLQLNNGNGTFSEIAQMAGVAKTDWSWSVLMEDLDNDGWRDMYVTNGIKRDVRNNDAQLKLREILKNNNGQVEFSQAMAAVPTTLVTNVCFKNNGDLTFHDATEDWGLYDPSTSHGMAIADLDGDGDLDMVINRQDTLASLLENTGSRGHYLRVQLKGAAINPSGIGATVSLTQGDTEQKANIQSVRGYRSCTEPIAHFGLGDDGKDVLVRVYWPDGRYSEIQNVKVDQKVVVEHASSVATRPERINDAPLFEVTQVKGLDELVQKETPFDDFREEILLPHRYSRLGPFMSKGDMNGDGRDDVFISGASGSPSALFIRSEDGSFAPSNEAFFMKYKQREDLGSTMFDADGDGDNDLLVVAGGNEVQLGSDLLRPLLLINDGKGNLSNGSYRLPDINVSAQKVVHADIDLDGDQDLFIGGRVMPGRYPLSPSSYILTNDGGNFKNATFDACPDLMEPGMITDAKFSDINGDGDMDLILAGEWMPLSIYENEGGKFTNVNNDHSLAGTEGWWYSLAVEDLDGDGDQDIVAGNLGLNTKYHASEEEPFHVYLSDFDGTGTYDIVLAMHQDNNLYPVRGRQCSSEQMPFIKDRFPTYEGFSKATVPEIFTPQVLDASFHRVAKELRSCIFINNGKDGFDKRPLPNRVQVSPVNAILVNDVDHDGHLDLIMVGNNHDTEVETTRYDASIGIVLLGDGDGSFRETGFRQSGFFADRNAKDMTVLDTPQGQVIVVANNQDRLQFFQIQKKALLGAL